MTTRQTVQRDERTVAVENAGYRWAWTFVTFALLIDVMYRAAVHNEAAWDLMALVIVPGLVCTIYQARQKTLGQGWLWKATLFGLLAAVLAAAVALTMTRAM